MRRAKFLEEIDQLRAIAIDKFGNPSRTVRALNVAFEVAKGEIKEIADDQEAGWDERAEYEAAHAEQRINEARAINQGR